MFAKESSAKDKVMFTKTSAETNGEYSILYTEIYSGTGPPMHYHKIITQTFTVEEGILYLKINEKTHVLKKGDIHIVPPMVPHGETSEKGKVLKCRVRITPGHEGYEDFMNLTYNGSIEKLTPEERQKIYLNADTYKP